MTIEAKVILDSVAPNGVRITTFELTYPRFIHAELMTHRVLSRNAASSRAIPTPKKIERIRKDCAVPSEWGVNQKGMQAAGPLAKEDEALARAVWDEACDKALYYAGVLCGEVCENCGLSFEHENPCNKCMCGDHAIKLELHKQVGNRILEPFDHITTVVTTTKLNNHWKLRLEKDPVTGRPMADPTYFELATKWKAAFDASTPYKCGASDWHLPYVSRDEGSTRVWVSKEDLAGIASFGKAEDGFRDIARKVSVGRVARTSYMRQGQGDIAENVKLHDGLSKNGHWSPFEAVATPIDGIEFGKLMAHGRCGWCWASMEKGDKVVNLLRLPNPAAVCFKCAQGHVTSGNFVGWHQYRKEFAGEAGGD